MVAATLCPLHTFDKAHRPMSWLSGLWSGKKTPPASAAPQPPIAQSISKLVDALMTSTNRPERRTTLSDTGILLTDVLLKILRDHHQLPHPHHLSQQQVVQAAAYLHFIAAPLISLLQAEGTEIELPEVITVCGIAVFNQYPRPQTMALLTTGAQLFKETVADGRELKDLQVWNQEVWRACLNYVRSGNQEHIDELSRLYEPFCHQTSEPLDMVEQSKG